MKKKVLPLALLLSFTMTSAALAADMKTSEEERMLLMADASVKQEAYVGENRILRDGEMGITSLMAPDEAYVGENRILLEGEMGITSVSEPEAYVGENRLLLEGEMGITSTGAEDLAYTTTGAQETTGKTSYIWYGVAAAAAAGAAGGFAAGRKTKAGKGL